jgi:hypothetical protein
MLVELVLVLKYILMLAPSIFLVMCCKCSALFSGIAATGNHDDIYFDVTGVLDA